MTEALVVSYTLVLARVGTFVAVLPVLGGAAVPRMVKAGLALALTTFLFTRHGAAIDPTLLTQAGRLSWLTYGLALAREALLGALLGYVLGLVLLPVKVAGEYLGQEMGLSLGPLLGPTSSDPATVVSQVFEALATLLLLGLDGHHLFLAALEAAFLHQAVGAAFGAPPAGDLVTGMARSQEWGLMLAAPLGAVLFLTSVALALMARAAPQLNVFAVGFPLRVLAGLIGIFVLVPELVRGIVHALGHFGDLLWSLV